jgi:hypothetical protein
MVVVVYLVDATFTHYVLAQILIPTPMPRAPPKPKPAPLLPQTTTLILKMTKTTKATTNLPAVEALHLGKRSLVHFNFASSHFSPVTPSLTLAAAAAAAAAATATARIMRNRRPPAKPSDRRNSDFLFLCASRKSLEISLQLYFPAILVLKQVIRNVGTSDSTSIFFFFQLFG